jgi:glycosyltransferase involved in cell wall biosynthesis
MTDLSPDARLVSGMQAPNLVSVVITCYNQGRFLAEAIESVLCQTYQSFETLIIDDGSTDNTPEVSSRYKGVRYVFQPNMGLSAARNRGVQEGRGDFFVFLDADDRFLPAALEAGVKALIEHPECAFAFGDYRDVACNGTLVLEPTRLHLNGEYYLALLRGNCIEMHATVIYRRTVFENIGPFDTSLRACEDYDLFLRVSRQQPICHYGVQVAEYRQHDSNMSANPALMLRSTLAVLRSQKEFTRGNLKYKRSLKFGLSSFAGAFAMRLIQQSWTQLRLQGHRRQALKDLFLLCRIFPLGTLRCAASFCARRLPGVSRIRSRFNRRRE